MNTERLIEDLTELVCRQLAGDAGGPPPSPTPPWSGGVQMPGGVPSYPVVGVAAPAYAWLPTPPGPPRPQFLLAMGDGERGVEAWVSQARVAAITSRVIVVPSAAFPRARVLGLMGDGPVGDLHVLEQPPASWDALVRESRAVFVPNAGLNAVAGIASLIAIEPCVGAALRGLIEGRPVLVGSDEIDFLTLHATHLARPFVQGVRTHATTAQSMGARLVDATTLGQELVSLARNDHDAGASRQASRGRCVLTKDDVDMLLRSGHRVIEVPAGSIITSLAQEAAAQAGVEIVVR